jgi:hypothetical protein
MSQSETINKSQSAHIVDYLAVHSPVGHAGGGAQIPRFWVS